MLKRIASVAALLLAACGGESKQSTSSDVPPGRPPHLIPISAALDVNTTYLKVVLNATRTIPTPVTTTDANDNAVPVPCSTDANCKPFDAAAYCAGNACTKDLVLTSLFYVKNMSASGAAIPVPCDGGQYSVEVIEALNEPTTLTTAVINKVDVSAAFTMDPNCVTSPTTIGWAYPALPTFWVPTIYAGIGAAPYDAYTVRTVGVSSPWSFTNWSLTADGVSPTTHTGNSATFASPATASAITFDGRFHLDRSVLIGGEGPTSWEWQPSFLVTPVASGTVNLP
jgi:hypothetical protein